MQLNFPLFSDIGRILYEVEKVMNDDPILKISAVAAIIFGAAIIFSNIGSPNISISGHATVGRIDIRESSNGNAFKLVLGVLLIGAAIRSIGLIREWQRQQESR